MGKTILHLASEYLPWITPNGVVISTISYFDVWPENFNGSSSVLCFVIFLMLVLPLIAYWVARRTFRNKGDLITKWYDEQGFEQEMTKDGKFVRKEDGEHLK